MANINQRLNGLEPLSYAGVNAVQPPDFITRPVDPTPNDSKNFYLGAIWLNTATEDVWMLVNLYGNSATWVMVTGAAGSVLTLTGNAGGAVGPLLGNINVVGDAVTIDIVGNPATNTLTASATGIMANSFPTDAGTATPAAGVLKILGGTGGRDINTSGSGNTIHIDLDNAITLGDLAALGAGVPAATLTTGSLTLAASTAAAATNPIINFSSNGNTISFFLNSVFIGQSAGNTTRTPGVALFNVAIGPFSQNLITTATNNTSVGNATLGSLLSGQNNSMFGGGCGGNITTGSNNHGFGENCFNGGGPGVGLLTGSYNVALGTSASSAFTGAESSNININSVGVVGDGNTLRIGAGTGTSAQQLNKAFISGIRGITTGSATAIAVLIDTNGQLGTVSSSARYKENIKDMGSYSECLYNLRPVVFNYKQHSSQDKSVGLIAEEVEQYEPRLVVYDKEGLPETVKYHDLVPMLLNELQKLKYEVKELKKRVS